MEKTIHFSHCRGFTLVELMVVIAIMAILAVAGSSGVVHMVPSYQQRACEEERDQAVRAFISDWLETRQLAGDKDNLDSVARKWLSSYLENNQVNCSKAEDWVISLETASGGGYTVTITCPTHQGKEASAQAGQKSDDGAGGIGWDGNIWLEDNSSESITP